MDPNGRSQPISIGHRAHQPHLQEAHRRALGKIAQEHLRRVIPLIGHQVEVPIAVHVESHRRARTCRAHHLNFARAAPGQRMTPILGQRRIEHERLPQHRISPARLQAQHRLRIHEALAPVVEQQRIGHIAQRIAHSGRHEHVLVAVGIEVGHRHAPGPVGFGAHRRRHLRERVARTLILEEPIAEHTVGGPTEQLRLPLRRAPRIALGLIEGHREIRITRIDLRRRHVGVHVGDDQIHQPVAVVVEELHAHRTPRRLAKERRRPVLKAAPLTVHIIAVFARHAQHVEFRKSIGIQIAKGRIAAPAPMDESCRLRSILKTSITPIVEEQARLAAFRILPALKGV